MAATRKLTVEILGDAKGAMTAFGSIQKGTQGLGESFVAFGRKAALAFAGIAVGAVAIGKSVVKAASDLNENLSKTNVVFGDAAEAVIAFSKTAAKSIGQSQNQALEAAGTFGIFGKSAGLTGKELSGFSTDLVKLASDMASFSNTTPQEAIEALGAALRGESEPIRRYGVLLDDAALKAKALEMGIYDGNGSLKAQQRILAANALIFEQTIDQQDDFIRTQDGMANRTRSLAAIFDDLKTKLGTFLLPIVLDITEQFAKFVDKVSPFVEKYGPKLRDLFGEIYQKVKDVAKEIAEKLEPILRKIVDWMKENTDVVKVFFGVLAGAAVLASIAALASSLSFLFSPIGLVIAGIALLAAGIYYAYTRFDWFRNAVDSVGRFFKDKFAPAMSKSFEAIKSAVEKLSPVFEKVFSIFGGPLLDNIRRQLSGVVTMFSGLFKTIEGLFSIFAGLFTGNWSAMWDGIKSTLSGAVQTMRGAARIMFSPLITGFQIFGNVVKTVFSGVRTAIGAAVSWIVTTVSSGWNRLVSITRSIFSNLTGVIKSILQGAINFFVNALNKVIDTINGAIRLYNSIPIAPDIPLVGKIPEVQLAKGGIVTGPTIALIGEAGPEAVVPLSSPYAPDFSMGGKGNVYITVKVDAGLVSSPDQVGAQIIDAIKRAERRSGQVFLAA